MNKMSSLNRNWCQNNKINNNNWRIYKRKMKVQYKN